MGDHMMRRVAVRLLPRRSRHFREGHVDVCEPGTLGREPCETGSSASAKRRCARLSPRWPTQGIRTGGPRLVSS